MPNTEGLRELVGDLSWVGLVADGASVLLLP